MDAGYGEEEARKRKKEETLPNSGKNKTLPKALLISANDNASYADILRRSKKDSENMSWRIPLTRYED